MDQNLKCLSAAEEKVLTLKPTEGLHVWFALVWFGFCFAAASPPLVDLLSAFSSLHGMLHSFHLASFISSSLVASLPLHRVSTSIGDVGASWVGHLFTPSAQVAVKT